MKSYPDVSLKHLRIIKKVLQNHLPINSKVWVFGSRAQKAKKKYSDLDLAIDLNSNPLSVELLTNLNYDFDESDLPYKVDIVDWNTTDPSFQRIIRLNRIELNWKK